ncbi:prepilin-type N-terminal cleavage/methylation domain-containing protein [Planktotalea sp.]|uniref:type IV pilus modification PilV family protein n=1 Tax=Planktotalea sp. TaxID=2029877 RepID=UPI00329971E4
MRRRLKQDQGLTLVELAVAVLVLSIGSIAALRATDQSRVVIGGSETRSFAQIAARNRAEELKLLGPSANLPSSVTLGGQTFELEQDNETTAGGFVKSTITAKSQRGGALYIVYLPFNR